MNAKTVLIVVAGLALTASAAIQDFYVGVNYWGSKNAVDMWRDWDPDSVQKDIEVLADNGVKLIRAFPTWRDFQPLERTVRWRSIPYGWRQGGKPLANVAAVERKIRKTDPGLVVTEHPDRASGRTLAVIVNTNAEDGKFPVKVDGTVRNVWNGVFADGFISLRGNDGCVMEIE